jgi:hypothetical protein
VGVTIRTYRRDDAAGVADVFYRSVREVAVSEERQDKTLRGVPIHNYRMEKILSSG